MAAALLFSAMLFFQLISAFQGVHAFDGNGLFAQIEQAAGSLGVPLLSAYTDTLNRVVVGFRLLSLVPTIFILAGMWILYSACRDQSTDGVAATGATIIKVVKKTDDLSRAYAEKVTITIQSISRTSDHEGTAGITVQSPEMPSILTDCIRDVLQQKGSGTYSSRLQQMKDSVKKKLSGNCAMKKTALKIGIVKENGKWKLAQIRKLSDALDGGMTDSLSGILKDLKVGEAK